MPRKPCYWTRKLELELVEFVRQREFIWKPVGNTNHHIQQKYKAYAEFAANLGRGFTARSVRDRWVNIRSTFNHNLRRVDKSKETARSQSEVYVPCWPLWKPLQFLQTIKNDTSHYDDYPSQDYKESTSQIEVKVEASDLEEALGIRQRVQRTDRPRRRDKRKHNDKCVRVIEDLAKAVSPLASDEPGTQYWFLGRHVTERLNAMEKNNADCAARDIIKLFESGTEQYKRECGL
ncbi:uncharacterized protein LOC133319684 [Danaus plexippus]|uniref:uncharacterized protein LOC133319684 n=1 Tax=Danaus plexippus TaxID=13037 RepID=UPI002AB20867|nr:uncharacterized protein LOC133319684 [Danaus plexippus]